MRTSSENIFFKIKQQILPKVKIFKIISLKKKTDKIIKVNDNDNVNEMIFKMIQKNQNLFVTQSNHIIT